MCNKKHSKDDSDIVLIEKGETLLRNKKTTDA